MIRLAIAVEGETEERFVKDVLASHLLQFGIFPTPKLLGGRINADRVVAYMANLFWDFGRVTSLVDFYGFRGKGTDTVGQLEQRVFNQVDARIGRSWDQSRVFPYVQMHEFEGLLFTDVEAFAAVPGATSVKIESLRTIRSSFQTPEDINDSSECAPSRRIKSLLPRYQKVVHGPSLAADIGLDAIRGQCPRFDGWLSRLEALGGDALLGGAP